MDVLVFNDIKPVFISAVIVVNIILNSLVIAVIVKFPQLREDQTTLFMLSLALSDLANGCTAMPISAALCSSATPYVRDMTTYLPKVQMFCSVWFTVTSLHSLCWVTVCKMVAITRPFRYEQILTRRRCYVIIGITWSVAGLLAVLLLRGDVEWEFVTCMYYIEGSHDIVVVFILAVIYGLVMPVIAIIYATSRIFCVIVRTHHQTALQVCSMGREGSVTENVPSVTMKSLRSGRNVLLMCLAYVILTIPMVIDVIFEMTGRSEYLTSWFKFIAVWIMQCNSSVNSVIYLILFKSVRSKTTKMFSILFDVMKSY